MAQRPSVVSAPVSARTIRLGYESGRFPVQFRGYPGCDRVREETEVCLPPLVLGELPPVISVSSGTRVEEVTTMSRRPPGDQSSPEDAASTG
jgi:hypothetical protein